VNVSNAKRSTGRARFQEMEFTKAIDAATPVLYANCAAGTSLGEAKLQVGRISAGEYKEVMAVLLINPIISQIATGGYGEGKVPMDSFTINFTECGIEYTAQDATNATGGKTAFGWNLTTNTAS
jgi:type VI secretion system secreted protein Hcp